MKLLCVPVHVCVCALVYVVVRLVGCSKRRSSGCGGEVGALQDCGKGKQAAAVTYIDATPADVSNGCVHTSVHTRSHTIICNKCAFASEHAQAHTHTHTTDLSSEELQLIFHEGQSKCVKYKMCEFSTV